MLGKDITLITFFCFEKNTGGKMNKLSRTIFTIGITLFSVTLLIESAAFAASDRRVDNCRPTCDTIDDTITTEVKLFWTAPTTRTDGEPLTPSELEGFIIYYGTDSNNLIPLVDLNDNAITTYTITDLSPGNYYFAVTAYDYDGLESDFSEIVNKEI